jgi:hypothetical protein
MKSTTVREELVVAMFDDAADIVKRLELLAPLMDDARSSLAFAAQDLAAQAKPFKDRMHQIAADEQYRARHYVREHVEQTSRVCQEQQAEALKNAGRAVLKEEVGTTLHELVASLRDIVKGSKQRETLLIHVTIALVSIAGTAGLLLSLLPIGSAGERDVSPNGKASVESPSPVPAAAPAVPPPVRARARR